MQPLKSGELELLAAISETKIVNEPAERLDELFRYCFMLVGLREKSFPNELETLFLYEFLKENYGGHSISEIKLAFKMAIKGELDLPLEDVKSYENFSVVYLSSIINSYRRWSGQEYRHLEKHIPPNEEDIKYLEGPKKEIHWGFTIEREYQHFLSFGDEHWKLYPIGFYEQLVKDEILDSELFRKAMLIVRTKLIGQLEKQRAALEMRKFENAEKKERVAFAQSINKTNLQELIKKIDAYKSGEQDSELEVVAKQYCVLQFFKNSKQNMKQHVYVAAE